MENKENTINKNINKKNNINLSEKINKIISNNKEIKKYYFLTLFIYIMFFLNISIFYIQFVIRIKNNDTNNSLINNLKNKEKFDENILENLTKIMNYYDISLKINSISEINNNGWDIIDNNNLLNKINFSEYLKIGVIGSINKGKTFLINKFLDKNIKFENKILTNGLNIKIVQNQNILFFDYGFDKINSFNESKNILNKKINKLNSVKNFIENFIINHSDMIIIIVNLFDINEQIFLKNLERELYLKKLNIKIYIVHNLQYFSYKSEIKNYFNQLKYNNIFELSLNELKYYENLKGNKNYFVEKNDYFSTIHYILAKENSEAGDFYNNSTLLMIINELNVIKEYKKFNNLIKEIKDNFIKYCKLNYNENINENNFEDNNMKIKLNKKLSYKKNIINNGLGLYNFIDNNIEPNYGYFIENKKLYLFFELAGDIQNLKNKIKIESNYYIIYFQGEKKIEKNLEKGFYNFYEGEIKFGIKININEFLLKTLKLKEESKLNGIYLYSIELQ